MANRRETINNEIVDKKPQYCEKTDCLRQKAYWYEAPYYYVNSNCLQCKWFIRDKDNLKTQDMVNAPI